MVTTFLLIRHGLTDAVGHRLTGRLPGVHLNETGRRQAAALPDRLARWKLDAIYSSPLERAMETAAPAAQRFQLPVQQNGAFAEFDFGRWAGTPIADLEKQHEFQMFCRFRSGTQAPGGESILEVQNRMVIALTGVAAERPGQTIAVFSHADAIKSALMHFLAIPLDYLQRVDIFPASISVTRLEPWGPVVSAMNLHDA